MESARSELAIYWLDEPAEFTIDDGIGCCTVRSGAVTFQLRSKTSTMVAGMANASRAYASFLASRSAEVIKLRAFKRQH